MVCGGLHNAEDPRCQSQYWPRPCKPETRWHESAKEQAQLKAPVPQLEGTYPVVLYFANDEDRDYFIEIVKAAKPGLQAVKL